VALRLRFVPLFDTLLLRCTLHALDSSAAAAVLKPGVMLTEADMDAATARTATPIELPSVTVPNVSALWPSPFPGGSSGGGTTAVCGLSATSPTIASLTMPPATLAALRALLFSSLPAPQQQQQQQGPAQAQASLLAQVNAARKRLRQGSMEEALLRDFIDHVLSTPTLQQQQQQQQQQQLQLQEQPISTVARLLIFPNEQTVTVQSAFLGLLHLLLAYEGFTPAATGAGVSAAMPLSFSPSSFSSTQSVFTLSFQHSSLLSLLPRHVVRFKIVSLFGETFVLHAQLLDDVEEPQPQQSQQQRHPSPSTTDAGDPAGSPDASTSAPAVATVVPMYKMTLTASLYFQPGVVGRSVAELASSSPMTAASLFRNLGSLLSQLRNRVTKHLLGSGNGGGGTTAAIQTGGTSNALERLPSELLLGVLQLLPSSDLVAVGNCCWSLQYASAHPFLWQQLCAREMPAAEPPSASSAAPSASAPASASSAGATSGFIVDWKEVYLSRLAMREQSRARAAAAAAALERQRSNLNQWWEDRMRAVVGPYPTFFLPPRRQRLPYHPTPFGPHPDAPFFTLPGSNRSRYF
jgi:hypothetical protein